MHQFMKPNLLMNVDVNFSMQAHMKMTVEEINGHKKCT